MTLLKYISAITLLLLIACDSKPTTESNNWENTKDHYLKGKKVSIKLPEAFKVSSRYRIKDDLPKLNTNRAALLVVQNALEKFEASDESVDVFIDTTSNYHFVTVLDSEEKIALDKSSAARLGKLLLEDYDKMDLSKRGIKVSKLESNIKKNNNQKLVKYKFEILDKRKKTKTYATSFFITNSTRTLVIHEFSDSPEDLEYYTWSIKENY